VQRKQNTEYTPTFQKLIQPGHINARNVGEDKVRRLGQGEASVWLHQFTDPLRQFQRGLKDSQKAAVSQQLFDNACGVTLSIPCSVLNVSPTGQFWKEIESDVCR
jgi:hypothetical protein